MSRQRLLSLTTATISALLITTLNPVAIAAKPSKAKSIAGREGDAVNTILNGRGAPKANTGVDGDFFIDVTSFTIYGPKKNGKWPVGVSLRGPQGLDGKVGERGTTGSAGASTKGDKGEKGDKGDKGEVGERGERGATGATGEAGPQGATGPTGATGATGSTGATGADGPAGAQGVAGATGATGSQGVQGEKGDKGDTGNTGPAGATGATGPTGPSNVFVGSITFSNNLAGAAGEPITSDTFGTLMSDANYQVDLVISGSGTSDISVLPLHFEVLTNGGSRSITNVQWTNASVQSLRNGSTVVIEHTIQARFAVNGSGTGTNSSLQVRLKAGASTLTKPVTFTGDYKMQKVGSVG
jgi:hypothetical protein